MFNKGKVAQGYQPLSISDKRGNGAVAGKKKKWRITITEAGEREGWNLHPSHLQGETMEHRCLVEAGIRGSCREARVSPERAQGLAFANSKDRWAQTLLRTGDHQHEDSEANNG